MGKTGRKNKRYSAEFKISVIMDMREHHLSYNETVKKYNLGNPQYGAARAMLQRWERIYYNNERISTKLKGMSPVQYRTHSLAI